MSDLKEKLFALAAQGMPEADVNIPGVGAVRVRGLSRVEVISTRKATDREDKMDGTRVLMLERKMLAAALLDPVLTEAEVGQLQRTLPAGVLQPVSQRIQELSAMAEGAPKAAYKSVRGGPGDGVRILPGAEAESDGGGTPPADEQ